MSIDRQRVKETFKEYVNRYEVDDPKINLKIVHTYKVADIAERIAKSINLPEEDVDLAWIMGMLHDIGRFEQCRIFNTFIDSESIDHAKFGCHLLFGDPIDAKVSLGDCCKTDISNYCDEDYELIHDAIYYHNVYRLPENMDARTKMFADILRDADKIDILRVNVVTPLEDVYNVSTKELRTTRASEEVMEAFFNETAIDRRLKKSAVDHVVGHISLVYELVYNESYRIVLEQGYLDRIMNFESQCDDTVKQFDIIKKHMHNYLKCKDNYQE